jgi:hypothetical protein
MRYAIIAGLILCGCDYSPTPLPKATKWKELSPHLSNGNTSWGGLWVYDDVERGYVVYSTDDGIMVVPMHLPAECK